MSQTTEAVSAAQREWTDRDWINVVLTSEPASAVRQVLADGGYCVCEASGTLVQKMGHCDGCHRRRLLHHGLNSEAFLCVDCWHDELCSS